MLLFTKPGCKKCDWIKDNCDLSDITVHDTQTIDGLALLAWYELVGLAETGLPILLITDKYDREVKRVTGAIKIRDEINKFNSEARGYGMNDLIREIPDDITNARNSVISEMPEVVDVAIEIKLDLYNNNLPQISYIMRHILELGDIFQLNINGELWFQSKLREGEESTA